MKKELQMSLKNGKTESCVVCKCDTKVAVNTHVEKRKNYVYGVGQTCSSCYNKLYHLPEYYDAK